jgi:hypothetical protein
LVVFVLQAEFAQKLELVKQWALSRSLRPDLQQRVQNLMYYLWQAQMGSTDQELAQSIPPHLHVELMCEQV